MRDPSSKILKCYKCQSSERSKLQTAADTMLLLMRDPNSKVLQVPRKWRSKLQNGAVQMPGKTTSTRKREKNPKRNGKKKQKMQPFSISMSRYCDYKNTSHKKHPIQLNFQNIHNHCSQECSWVLCRAGDHRKIMKTSSKMQHCLNCQVRKGWG